VAICDPKGIYLNKLESPCPKDVPCQNQCIPASGSWEEHFWRFNKIFLILTLIGPQNGSVPLFEQIWIPIPNQVSHQNWSKLAQWFLRRSRLKKQTDRQTDAGKIAMAIARLSLKLRWAKMLTLNPFSYWKWYMTQHKILYL